MTFSIRREALEQLLNDPEWDAKLRAAKTRMQMFKVLVDFSKARGLKLLTVE